MYRKVLVPLDGSSLAECTLSHVKELAKDGHIEEVILLRVAEMKVPLNYIAADDTGIVQGYDLQTFWSEEIDKTKEYLNEVQERLNSEGIKADSALIKGYAPAQAIIDFSRENGVDLIVMATHGYTGMKKFLLGSVASRVANESEVPVLLIRPDACRVNT